MFNIVHPEFRVNFVILPFWGPPNQNFGPLQIRISGYVIVHVIVILVSCCLFLKLSDRDVEAEAEAL